MAAEFDRILVFDLDGTLVNSQEAHALSYNMAFGKHGLPEKPLQEIISKFGPPAELVIKELFPNIEKNTIGEIAAGKRKLFIQKTVKQTKPIPGVVEALEELSKNFGLVLLSNSSHEEIDAILKVAKIRKKLFTAIFGYGEIHSKPDPDIIETVEKKAKGKVEYFIGDTIYDIRTGNNAEVRTIAVLTGVHDVKTLSKEDPTIIIESVALLPEYFGGEL